MIKRAFCLLFELICRLISLDKLIKPHGGLWLKRGCDSWILMRHIVFGNDNSNHKYDDEEGSETSCVKSGMNLLNLPRDALLNSVLGGGLLSCEDLTSVDFAFCNKKERPRLLEVLRGLAVTDLPTITDVKFLTWIASRRMHLCQGRFARELKVDIEGIQTPSQLWFAAAARNKKGSHLALQLIRDMEVGISADHTDCAGRSVLHNAAQFNQVDMIRKLVGTLGCSVDLPDHNGDTPLAIAARFNRFKCARELLILGANVSAENHAGSTPLFVCSHEGHTKVAKLLVDNKAQVNCTNITGDTPLLRASAYGHAEVVKLLIEHGGSVNQRNHLKTTPLHVSIHNGHTEITKLLLDNHADVNSPGRRGPQHTPLQQALNQKANDIAYVLAINYGANTSDCVPRPRRT